MDEKSRPSAAARTPMNEVTIIVMSAETRRLDIDAKPAQAQGAHMGSDLAEGPALVAGHEERARAIRRQWPQRRAAVSGEKNSAHLVVPASRPSRGLHVLTL